MKEEIIYLYNFNDIEIHKNNNSIIFFNNGNKYLVEECNKREGELLYIYNISLNDNLFNKIIKTRFNRLLFNYDNVNYIVIKVIHDNNLYYFLNSLNYRKNYNNLLGTILDHSNWNNLISKKIDYIEYQYDHIKGKYKLIDESIDYYIGMAELSISYYRSLRKDNDILTFSHKRINNDTLHNPKYLIIDSVTRDVSGILKYIFFYDLSINLRDFILNLDFNRYQYEKLISRMIYPSFYFDSYEKIVNNNDLNEEKNIKKFIEKSDSYEKYISNIINIISFKFNVIKPF